MTTWELLFWGAAAVPLYVYLIYPLIIGGCAFWFRDPVVETQEQLLFERKLAAPEWPFLSIIIAAFREESVITGRLVNAVLLDYPADRLEIIVGVDGDEDCTGELVAGFHDSRVKLMQFPVRRGKASVLNDCVAAARGEILVFTDANTNMDVQALRRLARHFAVPAVGGVCGELRLVDPVHGQNVDGLYWKFENFLKSSEARVGALLGVNGGIYALRKDLYEPIPPQTIVDDFLIGMRVHLRRRQLLFDASAVAFEETPPTLDAEFQRRARIGAGGFQSLVWLWPLLLPTRGWVAYCFWSHKVLRWICPAALCAAFVANLALVGQPFYAACAVAQVLFYTAAVAGGCLARRRRVPKLLRVPALFVSVNAALLVGFWRWLRGIRHGTWKRTERTTIGA